MQEIFLKITLIIFAFIALFWIFTSPKKSFQVLITNLSLPRVWLTIFFNLVPVVQVLLAIIINNNISWSFGTYDIWIELIGFIIFNLGVLLATLAKAQMKTSWGAPAQHNIKIQNKLVISGTYAISRNPIYLGLIMVFLGFEMVIRSYLIILVLPLYLYIIYVIWIEEKLLVKYFGKSYVNYLHRVPRFFSIRKFLGI